MRVERDIERRGNQTSKGNHRKQRKPERWGKPKRVKGTKESGENQRKKRKSKLVQGTKDNRGNKRE